MATTLITGASSGIGLELAKQFAAGGDDVTLVARREDKLQELAAEIQREHGVTATVIPGWKNRLSVTGSGFLPRFATRKLVGKMQGAQGPQDQILSVLS